MHMGDPVLRCTYDSIVLHRQHQTALYLLESAYPPPCSKSVVISTAILNPSASIHQYQRPAAITVYVQIAFPEKQCKTEDNIWDKTYRQTINCQKDQVNGLDNIYRFSLFCQVH